MADTVLVTGGSGYIAGYLIRQLVAGGWQVRTTDFDFLMSPQAREVLDREGIILLGYTPFQTLWQKR